MIHIAICDDDAGSREELEKYCKKYFQERTDYISHSYSSGEEFLRDISGQRYRCEVLFLDIEMGGMDGLRVKNRLEELGEDIRILFVTNYDSYMRDAYGEKVWGYLSKPVVYQELERKMDGILNDIQCQQRFEMARNGDKSRKVFWQEIKYVKSCDKYVDFHLMRKGTEKADIKIYDEKSYKFWNERLDSGQFLEVGKGMLVNMENVKSISKKDKIIIFEDGTSGSVSVRKAVQAFDILAEYRYKREKRRRL